MKNWYCREDLFLAIIEKEGSPAGCKNQWKSYKTRSKLAIINTYSLANHVFAVQIAFEHVFVSKIDGKVIFWPSKNIWDTVNPWAM